MPQYMLSVHTAPSEPSEAMTAEEQQAGYARIAGIEADMEAADAFVFSARLSEPSAAKVVRRGPGRPKHTDGPFAETKEQLGGFYLIEADTLDEALEIAARVPGAKYGAIEVRPVAQVPARQP